MIGLGAVPHTSAYVPTAQAQLAGLYRDVAQRTSIPETKNTLPGKNPRETSDRYDKDQATTGLGFGAANRGESAKDSQAANTNNAGQSADRGTTDDSRGEGRQQQEQRRQELAQQAQIAELAARDRAVRAHEAAHAAVGGQYAGTPSFSYQTGPDGRRYAAGGEVSIDVSPVKGDPEATIRKFTTVASAALAPADPSAQDQRVAAAAQAGIAAARAEKIIAQRRDAQETDTFRREGKTDKVDASRVNFTSEPTTYIANPFGTRPNIAASKYIGGNSVIGIKLATPVDISSRLRSLGVTDAPAQEFRATA